MFGGIGYLELLIIGVIALLLYGKRLPDVARSWGSTYRDLRRSLNDIKSSINVDRPANESRTPLRPRIEYDDRQDESSPKFVPPPPETNSENESK